MCVFLGSCSALRGHPRKTTGTAAKAQEGTADTSIQSLRSQPGILLSPALPSAHNRGWPERGGTGQCQKGFLGNTWMAPPSLGPLSHTWPSGFTLRTMGKSLSASTSLSCQLPPCPSISLRDTVLLIPDLERISRVACQQNQMEINLIEPKQI